MRFFYFYATSDLELLNKKNVIFSIDEKEKPSIALATVCFYF